MKGGERAEQQGDLDREFAASTTLHGVARVAGSPRAALKLLWLAILLSCLGLCAWQVTDRFRRYFRYEAATAVSVEFVRDLDFPAVTVCNFNRFRKSALTEADLSNFEALLEYTDYDYDSYDDPEVAGTPSTNEPANFSYTEFTDRAGFRLDDATLLNCQWRGKKDSCEAQNFTQVFTSFGKCWTFNSGDNSKEHDVPILHQIQPGSGNGLKMIIDIQQREYTEPLVLGNVEAGLKVLVHDQETPPSVDAEGFAIGPGVHAFVGVRRREYINLQEPWGRCDASKTLTHYEKYTLSGCSIECGAKLIREKCQCRLVRHPGTEPECSPRQIKDCATPALTKLKAGELEACECPVPCNYREYRTSLSTAALPSNHIIDDLWKAYGPGDSASYTREESVTYIRENWILLDVYYESLNYERFQQFEEISPSALISDIGGQLGLFLGASFITMAEILDYIGRKAGRFITSCKQRKQTVGPSDSMTDGKTY